MLILSCTRDEKNGANAAIRNTWGRDIEHFFVIGKRGYLEAVPDLQEGLRMALQRGATNIFRCNTDTLVVPSRLLNSDYARADFIGNSSEVTVADAYDCTFAHGGCGFWLSARAAKVLIDAKPFADFEDQWTGRTLQARGIRPIHDARYSMGKSYKLDQPLARHDNDIISVHLGQSRGEFKPEMMYDAWRGNCE